MSAQPDTKLGRNDPCHCGSGKKYKKCCLDLEADEFPLGREPEGEFYPVDDRLLKAEGNRVVQVNTTTGEPYMPARLYYRVHDRRKVEERLRALKCVTANDDGSFSLSYWHEAKKFGLSVRYDRVPEDVFPILLAHCRFQDDEMLVDVRSYERAWRMIEFLDRHIRRDSAEVTHITIYNRAIKLAMARAEDVMQWDYDELFSTETLFIEPSYEDETSDEDIPEDDENGELTEEQKMEIEKKLARPFPLASKFAVPFYDGGFSIFRNLLLMRMMLAATCIDEDEDITLGEALRKLAATVESMSQEDDIENETPIPLLASRGAP